MVLRSEVAFKLTSDSIESLIKYYRGIHCPKIHIHSELEVKKLQEEFFQAIYKFVYRTHVSTLEGLELDGSGELLYKKSEEVKTNILSLLLQALPQKILPPLYREPPPLQKLHPLLHKAFSWFFHLTNFAEELWTSDNQWFLGWKYIFYYYINKYIINSICYSRSSSHRSFLFLLWRRIWAFDDWLQVIIGKVGSVGLVSAVNNIVFIDRKIAFSDKTHFNLHLPFPW